MNEKSPKTDPWQPLLPKNSPIKLPSNAPRNRFKSEYRINFFYRLTTLTYSGYSIAKIPKVITYLQLEVTDRAVSLVYVSFFLSCLLPLHLEATTSSSHPQLRYLRGLPGLNFRVFLANKKAVYLMVFI